MNDVECEKEGKMLVRYPSVFRRYMNDLVVTQQIFHDGRIRTRDILSMDETEFLYLTERKKELIKYEKYWPNSPDADDHFANLRFPVIKLHQLS